MAAMTLDDVVAQLKDNREMVEDNVEAQVLSAEIQEKTNQLIGTLVKRFDTWFDRDAADRLQAMNRGLGTAPEAPAPLVKPETEDSGGGFGSLGKKSLVAAIATAMGIAAYGAFNTKLLKPMRGLFNSTTEKMGRLFKFDDFKNNMKAWTNNIFEKLNLKFALGKMEFKASNFGQGIMKMWDDVKAKFGKLEEKFGKLRGWFDKNIFGPIDNFIKSFSAEKAPDGKEKPSKLQALVESMKDKFKMFKDWVGRVLGIIGRILTPIAVIFSGIDGLKEATKQLEEVEKDPEKDEVNATIETIGGFIAGFTGSFIGGFVDAIKNGLLWVVGKIFPGLVDEKTGEFKEDTFIGRLLKSVREFSAAQLITDAINTVFEAISKAINWVRDMLNTAASKLGIRLFSDEEENQMAREKMFDYNEKEQADMRKLRDKGIIGSEADFGKLTDEDINRIADENTGMMGTLSMSENEVRMMLKKRRAMIQNASVSTDSAGAMAGKMRALKEEQAAGNAPGAGKPSSVQWISPQVDMSNKSTNTSVTNKSVTIPVSPGGTNSISTDPASTTF